MLARSRIRARDNGGASLGGAFAGAIKSNSFTFPMNLKEFTDGPRQGQAKRAPEGGGEREKKREKTEKHVPDAEKDNFFSGAAVVFTGEMQMPRADAKQKVLALGGRVTTAISGVTRYLVAGDDPGEKKLQRASELKIRVLSESEFVGLMGKYSPAIEENMSTEIKKTAGGEREAGLQGTQDSREPRGPQRVAMWIDKHKPKSRAEFQGNKAQLEEVKKFLSDPHPKEKALLVSGPNGVGKTLGVHLVCRELGYVLVEYNGSDSRSRSDIAREVRQSVSQRAIALGGAQPCGKRVVLMDEIDCMAAQDRGGLAELISIIKTSPTPIVFIANDKANPKLRTLSNYCRHVVFSKADQRHSLAYAKSILEKEHMEMKESILVQLALGSGGDLRYLVNMLQYLSIKGTVTVDDIKAVSKTNLSSNPFELTRDLFSQGAGLEGKYQAYFQDPSMASLMVFENYLGSQLDLAKASRAAASLSFSDTVDRRIRYGSEWGLLAVHGLASSIVPTSLKNRLIKRIDFPKCLGQLSKEKKALGILSRLSFHLACGGGFGATEESANLRTAVLPLLFAKYFVPLQADNTEAAVALLVDLLLEKSDMDGIAELVLGAAEKDVLKQISTKTKTRLTRECNKLCRTLPYPTDKEKDREGPGRAEDEDLEE